MPDRTLRLALRIQQAGNYPAMRVVAVATGVPVVTAQVTAPADLIFHRTVWQIGPTFPAVVRYGAYLDQRCAGYFRPQPLENSFAVTTGSIRAATAAGDGWATGTTWLARWQRERAPDGSARSCIPALRVAAGCVAAQGASPPSCGRDVRRQPALGALGHAGYQQRAPQRR